MPFSFCPMHSIVVGCHLSATNREFLGILEIPKNRLRRFTISFIYSILSDSLIISRSLLSIVLPLWHISIADFHSVPPETPAIIERNGFCSIAFSMRYIHHDRRIRLDVSEIKDDTIGSIIRQKRSGESKSNHIPRRILIGVTCVISAVKNNALLSAAIKLHFDTDICCLTLRVLTIFEVNNVRCGIFFSNIISRGWCRIRCNIRRLSLHRAERFGQFLKILCATGVIVRSSIDIYGLQWVGCIPLYVSLIGVVFRAIIDRLITTRITTIGNFFLPRGLVLQVHSCTCTIIDFNRVLRLIRSQRTDPTASIHTPAKSADIVTISVSELNIGVGAIHHQRITAIWTVLSAKTYNAKTETIVVPAMLH